MDKNRKIAYFILKDVEDKKAYSNIAIIEHVKNVQIGSRPFIRELVYGVLRNKMYLDYILSKYVKKPLGNGSDAIILRMGLYQILMMDSVPDYAAVDQSVKLAKKFLKGRTSFINGVLREFLRTSDQIELPDKDEDFVRYLSIKYSFAPWIIEMWINEYGDEKAESILQGSNEFSSLTVRVNNLRTSRLDLARRLKERDVEVTLSDRYPETMYLKGAGIVDNILYRDGLYSIQDESSLMAVKMLDPKPRETIIDVCSAPGGKSLAAAEMMENVGRVISMDIYKRKLETVNSEANRLKLKIIETKAWDATRMDSSFEGQADRVIVDAPCSGLGTVRKKPEIKYKEWDDELVNLPKKQFDILNASAGYLKSGGILVYSTCTISKHENQDVVNRFLKANERFKKLDEVQLLPDDDKTNGFYICKMIKDEERVYE